MRSRWSIFALSFVAGLLLGFLVSVLVPGSALAGLYERWGLWDLAGRIAIVLLVLSISAVYIVWTISAFVPFVRPATESEERLHDLRKAGPIRRVLVATGGGPHAQFGLRLAADIVGAHDGELTLFSVLQPSEGPGAAAEQRELRHWATEVLGPDLEVQTQVTTNSSVVDAILSETGRSQYDLLVLGASDEHTVQSVLFGTIPDAVTARTSCSVLIVRAATTWSAPARNRS